MAQETIRTYLGYQIQAANNARVTGLEISTIVLRLDPVFLLVVIALELLWLGRLLSGKVGVGLLVVGLTLLVGDA